MRDVHVYTPPADLGLNIIHQDTDIVVVSKPSGLLSVPGRAETHKDCLETRVQQEFPTARIVHRLDMDTSGIMVMAMHADSHRHLGIQFEKRKVKKTYIAQICGQPEADSGRVDLPIRCDWENRPRQIVDHDQGKAAQTDWKVIKRSEDTTRIALYPVTGRTHQLRVHMQQLGHPILGDDFYAHEDAFKAADRLCLHAQDLGLYHPTTNEFLDFSDDCPF